MKKNLYALEFIPGTGQLQLMLSHEAVDFFNTQHGIGACSIGHFEGMKEAFKHFWHPNTFVLKDHQHFGLAQCGYFHYTTGTNTPVLLFNQPTTDSIHTIMGSLRVLFTVLHRHQESALQLVRVELPDTYAPRVYLSALVCKRVFNTLDRASDALRAYIERVHIPHASDIALPQGCGISMDTGMIRVTLFNGIRPRPRRKCTSVVQETDGYLSFSEPVTQYMHAYELIVAAALVSQVAVDTAVEKEQHLFIDAEDSL